MILHNYTEKYETEISIMDVYTKKEVRATLPAESLAGARHIGILTLMQTIPRVKEGVWISLNPKHGTFDTYDNVEGVVSANLEDNPDGFCWKFRLWAHPATH